jgi:hypothetical protein
LAFGNPIADCRLPLASKDFPRPVAKVRHTAMKMVTKPALLAVCAVGVGACAAWARHVERLVVMRAEAVPLSEAVSESAPEGGAALVAAPAPRRAVETLLKSLDDAQRTRAVFPFDAEERMNWHFVPKDRKGLRFDSLDARQQGLFLGVLKECLGASGLKKVETVRSIIAADYLP